MTFRNKILLSIWGVVLSLLVITYFIINYWTRTRIEHTFAEELRANRSTIEVLTKVQSATLIRSCQVIAESPRLRAVVELGDPKTAGELSQELSAATLTPLFVLTDRRGTPLARVIEGKSSTLDLGGRESIGMAMEHIATTDVWALENKVYRVVSAPILVDAELVGTLTIGFHLGRDDVATLKEATNSDVILAVGDSALVSTVDSSSAGSLLPSIASSGWNRNLVDTVRPVLKLLAAGETYLGTAFRLSRNSPADSTRISYLIVKPLSREVDRSMADILGAFGLVSLLFLLLTSVIGIVISRGITRPITDLVGGTNEVSRGNYDFAIQVRGSDEISYLGTKFMEMSRSLKEKISQLDRLNRDLLDRNADLDDTLWKLRQAQEELVRNERLAATGKMTAQLAHEINNPIHNIQSCLQTALNRLAADSRGRELIEVAFDEVSRMSRLTKQMLDIYRSSYVEVRFEPVPIGDIVKDTLAASQEDLSESGITVRAAIHPDLPPVNGSRDKLKQVFLNLILNARDAMAAGGTLDVFTGVKDDVVSVTFKDSGIGILEENLDRVFDAFFTTKDKVSGVGLGLSVCYGIVSQHGGTISVTSRRGNGSSFTVALPAIRLDRQASL